MSFARLLHGRWVHQRRAERLAAALAELIPPNARVLDVGCGDGLLDSEIARMRPDVDLRGIEVLVRERSLIPVKPFDGLSIPYGDGDFDLVLFVDVLHHATEAEALMTEAVRVARNGRLLIKDHVPEGPLAESTLRFMDWVGNAGRGFLLPTGYWNRKQWLRVFDELNLEVETWLPALGLYPVPFDWVFGRSLHFVALLRSTDGVQAASSEE